MERIYVVAVGGDGDQKVSGRYVGTDGEKAQAIFDAEGQDGNNSIVRFFHFPEHSQIRTPKRDGVEPRSQTSAVAAAIPTNREEYAAWLETLGRPALAEEGKVLGVAVKPGVSNVDVRAGLLAAKYPPAPAAGAENPPPPSEPESHGERSDDTGI